MPTQSQYDNALRNAGGNVNSPLFQRWLHTYGPVNGQTATGGPTGAPSVIPGAPPTAYNPAYGGIPGTPNPVATATGAITGNTSNLPAISTLAGGVNTFQQGQLTGQYNAAIPNYSALVGQSSANIGQELSGGIPQDVLNQIGIGAAERGVAGGSPGGAGSTAAYLRALGLTSIGQMQQGESNLTGAIQRAPIAAPFDITRMFVTPQDQQGAATAANTNAAAPIPSAAATAATNTVAAGAGLPGGTASGWNAGHGNYSAPGMSYYW